MTSPDPAARRRALEDPARLAALDALAVLDAPDVEEFDRIARLAAGLLDAPSALVNLVEAGQQVFIGRSGDQAATSPNSHGFCPITVAIGEPLLIKDVRSAPELRENPVVAAGVVAYAGAPLRYGDQVVGTICAIDTRPRAWGPKEQERLEDLAAVVITEFELRDAGRAVRRHAAEAESERLRTQAISEDLQAGLLPAGLPDVTGLQLAALYRPAPGETTVGGDFYDAFVAGDDVLLLLGDVCGKGARAAGLTALVRHTAAAIARRDRNPLVALEAAHEAILAGDADGRFVTAVCVRLRRARYGWDVDLVVAGHPLPLIVDGGGDVRDAGRPGTLLGAEVPVSLTSSTASLRPGETLVLHSDGLSETRIGGRLAETGLVGRLLAGEPCTAEQAVGRLRAYLERQDVQAHDDVAILAVTAGEPKARRPSG